MVKVGNVELSEEEIKEFKEVFDLVDKDKGGSISAFEVKELMGLLGRHPSMAEVEAMVAEIDIDGSGEVDFEEFLQVMAGQSSTSVSKRELTKAFRLFSDAGLPPGFIKAETLIKALVQYYKMGEEEAHRLVGQLGSDERGWINYKEKIEVFVD